jgi:outer membrane protein OmpA-like peptidoglycan-associated protein
VPAAAKYVAEVLDEAQSEARDVAKAKAEHEKAQKAKAEAEKKEAAKKADDHEANEEEEPALLTTGLKPLLRLVAKGQTLHTLMAKSGKKVVVMMSRKPIPPSRRKMLADELGGGSLKYFPGTCSLEAGAMTFALKSEVAGMAKLVKQALLDQTGLRLTKVKCRGDDGDDHDDDEEGGAAGAASGAAAATSAACATPDATATESFFDHDSAKLTPSDKTHLDAYAKAYLASKATDTITLEGFASVDGDKSRNDSLASDRANEVARYLATQGVPKGKLSASGKGPTDQFSKSNLCLNRRVTIRPKIDLKVRDFVDVVEEEPRNVPIPGKKPNVSLGEKAEETKVPDVPDPPPAPPEMVSRKVVRDALRDWLLDLGKAQGVKAREADVLSTSRVHVAEEVLLGTPGGETVDVSPVTPMNGDGRGYRADALADKIANNLPDEIPKKNFDNFMKLRAREAPEEKPIADQIRSKFDEMADQILSDFQVPKKYWDDIKDAVKKHAPDLIDKLPVNDTIKDLAKKAYEKISESSKGQ